jgi:hypothetical protein
MNIMTMTLQVGGWLWLVSLKNPHGISISSSGMAGCHGFFPFVITLNAFEILMIGLVVTSGEMPMYLKMLLL